AEDLIVTIRSGGASRVVSVPQLVTVTGNPAADDDGAALPPSSPVVASSAGAAEQAVRTRASAPRTAARRGRGTRDSRAGGDELCAVTAPRADRGPKVEARHRAWPGVRGPAYAPYPRVGAARSGPCSAWRRRSCPPARGPWSRAPSTGRRAARGRRMWRRARRRG